MSGQPVYYCEAIESALDFERKGEHFYRESIQKVEDEFAKKILAFLADEEKNHIKKIQEINAALNSDSEEFDYDTHCESGLHNRIKEHLNLMIEKEKSKIDPQSSDIAIYETAMDMEKAGYEMYEKSYQHSADTKTRKFFEFMKKEERIHYDLLASSKKYLEDPSYYFEDYGGWIFGGV